MGYLDRAATHNGPLNILAVLGFGTTRSLKRQSGSFSRSPWRLGAPCDALPNRGLQARNSAPGAIRAAAARTTAGASGSHFSNRLLMAVGMRAGATSVDERNAGFVSTLELFEQVIDLGIGLCVQAPDYVIQSPRKTVSSFRAQ